MRLHLTLVLLMSCCTVAKSQTRPSMVAPTFAGQVVPEDRWVSAFNIGPDSYQYGQEGFTADEISEILW